MPRSYYSVIQFVPDPFADERVNVGLVVLGPPDGPAFAVFTDSRRRAQRLAPQANLDALDRLRSDIEARLPSRGHQRKLGLVEPLTVESLQSLHAERGNVLQFSEPRPSSADPEELVGRLEAMYLRPLARVRRARGARAVRGTIKRGFEDAGLGEMLRPDVSVAGAHDDYSFAYGVVNGRIRHVIEAVSLDRADRAQIDEDLYSTAYRFEDLRRAEFREPMSLVVGSAGGGGLLDKARRILKDAAAEVILEADVPAWALSVRDVLAAH